MKHEKSCGAIAYRREQDKVLLLILRHRRGGHWSFPKGHIEAGENERQTALREVREETGLSIELRDGFRAAVEYSPTPGVRKEVVYFLGCSPRGEVRRQAEEISEIRWAEPEEAFHAVTFQNDKKLISLAMDRIQSEAAGGAV